MQCGWAIDLRNVIAQLSACFCLHIVLLLYEIAEASFGQTFGAYWLEELSPSPCRCFHVERAKSAAGVASANLAQAARHCHICSQHRGGLQAVWKLMGDIHLQFHAATPPEHVSPVSVASWLLLLLSTIAKHHPHHHP